LFSLIANYFQIFPWRHVSRLQIVKYFHKNKIILTLSELITKKYQTLLIYTQELSRDKLFTVEIFYFGDCSFVRENIIRTARISTLPRSIRKTNNHFNSMTKDGLTTPTLSPVVATAAVVSKRESTGLKP
jgi:hypothetical protein